MYINFLNEIYFDIIIINESVIIWCGFLLVNGFCYIFCNQFCMLYLFIEEFCSLLFLYIDI